MNIYFAILSCYVARNKTANPYILLLSNSQTQILMSSRTDPIVGIYLNTVRRKKIILRIEESTNQGSCGATSFFPDTHECMKERVSKLTYPWL